MSLRWSVNALCLQSSALPCRQAGTSRILAALRAGQQHQFRTAASCAPSQAAAYLASRNALTRSRCKLSRAIYNANGPKQRAYARKAASEQSTPKAAQNEPVEEVAEYEDWREYDPQYGVPLPNGLLGQAEITRIFGEGMDEEEGNHVLCVLQYRRLSGSLVDLGVSFPDLSHSRETYIKGLEYLRNTFPVDEEANAEAWQQEELKRLEQEQLLNRAVKLGIYKRDESAVEEEPQQGTAYGRERYGRSVFEEMRKENEARWEREQQELKEQEEKRNEELRKAGTPKAVSAWVDESGQRLPTLEGFKRHRELRAAERAKRNKAAEEKAQITQEKEPNMKVPAVKRLWGPTLVTVITLGLCWFLSETYAPPPTSARMFPDIPPAAATCLTLLGLNLLVFVAWRIPPAWRWLNRNMIVTPAWPRGITLLGSLFSHQTGAHLLANMMFLGFVGPVLHELLGRGNFLAIYVGSGVLGAYSSLVYHVLTRNFVAYSQGASGALYGVMAAFCMTTDKSTIHVPFTQYDVPMNYIGLLALCIAIDAIGLITKRTKGIDHVAHLAGYTGGILGALVVQKQAAERRRSEMEKRKEMALEANQTAVAGQADGAQ